MNLLYDHPEPHLPQLGKIQAMCVGRTPKKNYLSGALLGGVGLFALLITFGMIIKAVKDAGLYENPISIVILGLGFLAVFCAGCVFVYYHIQNGKTKSAIRIYEGGVHVVQQVSYIVNYGRFVQFCQGVREVTRSWRLVKKVTLREKVIDNSNVVEAHIAFTDGDQMWLSTTDEGEIDSALRTFSSQLADKIAD